MIFHSHTKYKQTHLILQMSHRVHRDDEIPGGSWRRQIDRDWSEKYGGYRSQQVQNGGEPSFYGKYVEPVLHATEHTVRGVMTGSSAEFGRAADEMKTVGSGLHTMEPKYQKQDYGK